MCISNLLHGNLLKPFYFKKGNSSVFAHYISKQTPKIFAAYTILEKVF